MLKFSYSWNIGETEVPSISKCPQMLRCPSFSNHVISTDSWLKLRPQKARIYILPIFLFSVVYNVTRFFELKTVSHDIVENVAVNNETDVEYSSYNESRNQQEKVVDSYLQVHMTEMREDPAWVQSCSWNFVNRCLLRCIFFSGVTFKQTSYITLTSTFYTDFWLIETFKVSKYFKVRQMYL